MGIVADFIFAQAKSHLFTPDFSSDNNQIEGLRHNGIGWRLRRSLTDFGSGYQGPRHPSFEEGLIGPDSLPVPEKTPNLTFQWLEHGSVRHEAEDFAESLPYYLLPEAEKIIPGREAVLPFIRKNWKIATAAGLIGLYMSKPLSLFSGRDDESNTLEGLRHGGLSQRMRRDMTPFGSGWKGILSREELIKQFIKQTGKDSNIESSLAKKAFRELIAMHHPDIGGETANMQILNDIYISVKQTGNINTAKPIITQARPAPAADWMSDFRKDFDIHKAKVENIMNEEFAGFAEHFKNMPHMDDHEGWDAWEKNIDDYREQSKLRHEQHINDFKKKVANDKIKFDEEIKKRKAQYQTDHPIAHTLDRFLNWSGKNPISSFTLVNTVTFAPYLLYKKIHGRDDHYNTIEGLSHKGIAKDKRHSMTEFGSGWDPMRALAKEAGMSLEKFVAQPHMKLAMASGDIVRELGQGTFGKVHLMESSVRIGEKEHTFQYARKSVFDNSDKLDIFHEVKAQRKLQDLNAPSVYGWSGNQIFMEPIHGVSASSHLRAGGQLPESFMSDLEKFIPEMHNRGIAHMDMTRDVNRLLGKAGPSGEVIPHNVLLTSEGRAAVIDYGSTMRPKSSTEAMHKIYNHKKYSSNAEFDMSAVESLRKNNGRLKESTIQEFDQKSGSTPKIAPPSAKTIRAKVRTNTQSIATKKTAKDMFRVGSGRKSRSAFSSTSRV